MMDDRVLMKNSAGQFPGPTIEVRAGDVLEIEVWNHLKGDEEGISIHWHGLYMRGW